MSRSGARTQTRAAAEPGRPPLSDDALEAMNRPRDRPARHGTGDSRPASAAHVRGMTAGESAFSTGWTRKTHGASASRSLSSCPGRPSALRWIPSRSAVVYWPAVRSSWPTRKQGQDSPPSRGAEDSLLTDDELFDAAHDQRPEVFRRLGDKVTLRFPALSSAPMSLATPSPTSSCSAVRRPTGSAPSRRGGSESGRWSSRSTRRCGTRRSRRWCRAEGSAHHQRDQRWPPPGVLRGSAVDFLRSQGEKSLAYPITIPAVSTTIGNS